MEATARQIRAIAQTISSTPEFPATERQCQRHENIVECGRAALAEYGLHGIRMTRFAIGLRMALSTLRRHFCDFDELLGEICRRHLLAVAKALGKVDPEAPDPARARRAAYIAATRFPYGGLNADHLLLTRDSPLLPPDELESIEATRKQLANNLAGPNCDCPEKILALLDNPAFDLAEIEALIANLAPPLTVTQQQEARAVRQASTSIASIPWVLPEGPPGHPNSIYSPSDPPIPWVPKVPEPVHNTA
jgi:AcrR family transcriptional regulator